MDFHYFALQVGLVVVGVSAIVIGYCWRRTTHSSQRRYYAKRLQAFVMVGTAFLYCLVLEPKWDHLALFWRLIPLVLLVYSAWLLGQARRFKALRGGSAVDS